MIFLIILGLIDRMNMDLKILCVPI